MNFSHDDEEALVVCGVDVAGRLINEEHDIVDSLVITNTVLDGEAILVPKQDFINWLYGHTELGGSNGSGFVN